MANNTKKAATKKAAQPKPKADQQQPAITASPIPFKGDKCIYVDAEGKKHDATVQCMHGGCRADLTIHATTGNTTQDMVPDESRADGGHYWKPAKQDS